MHSDANPPATRLTDPVSRARHLFCVFVVHQREPEHVNLSEAFVNRQRENPTERPPKISLKLLLLAEKFLNHVARIGATARNLRVLGPLINRSSSVLLPIPLVCLWTPRLNVRARM